MIRMIARRVAISIPLLFVVSAIVFGLQSLVPGDAALQIGGVDATAEQLAALREKLGLNEPIIVQYWNWLQNVFHGSLGSSLVTNEPVTSQLGARLPVTLSLVIGATVLATIVGVVLGVASSRGGRVFGGVIDVLSIVGHAVPSFWLALLLIDFFSVRLGWFPSTGYTKLGADPPGWLHSIALPAVALAIGGVTAIAKQTREAMIDTLQRDFVRSLRANGMPELLVVFQHALRSAAIPVVTMSGIIFVGALGGSVVIESVFGLPGLGSLAVTATGAKDSPIILGVAIYFTILIIAVNLLTDVLYGLINPKVRVS